MRRLVLLVLLSLVISPLALGQESNHQLCSARGIEEFLNARADIFELASQIQATPYLDDLLPITAEYIDAVSVLAFRAAFCQEGFETMWRLARFLNDVYAGHTMQLLSVADEDNPFLQAMPADQDLVAAQVRKLEAILESGERVELGSTWTDDGPDCCFDVMIFPVYRALEFDAHREEVGTIEDVEDILALGRAMILWREATWSVLPGCWVVFHHLMELGRLSQFTSMQRALEIAGASEANNPFVEALDKMLNPDFGFFGDGFMDERLRAEKRPIPTVFGIPACSLEDLQSFAHMPDEFDRIVANSQTIVTAMERLDFIQAQVLWRRRLWLQMPMCSQVLEMSWLMQQISSDHEAMQALQVLAGGELDTPYSAQVDSEGKNMLRLRKLRDSFEAFLSGEKRVPKQTSALVFTCGREIGGGLRERISVGFYDLVSLADEFISIDDALLYSQLQNRWRQGFLSRLPHCPEAFELGWWTALQTISSPLSKVLELAGVPEDKNPYIAEDELALFRWIKVGRNLNSGDPLPKESGTVRQSRLQSCSDADESSIAIAAVKYEELLKFPRATTIDEMVEYAATYLEWRDISFRAYPLCLDAHNIRLQFTQIIGDVIARRTLDIDGRLYRSNAWRQLPNDTERFGRLTDALFDSRRALGPPPHERMVATCTVDGLTAVSELATGVISLASVADALELPGEISPYHQQILDWREDMMARLPQCAGAVELGWLMNDISIDLSVLQSLIFVGADVEALPHTAAIVASLEQLSLQMQELGIAAPAEATP